jgi:hypothetical protein
MSDINEAAKPILAELGIALLVSDDLVMIGERYYIKATASLVAPDGSILASSVGYAREEETKKGMDASQITGSCSSYARKYAANGLFAIDDTKDADATNQHDKAETKKPAAEPTTKDALRDQAANEYAAELCQQIDLCTTMEKLVEWRKANSDKVNGLAPVHKAKVTAYWMEIEKIIKES